MTYDVQLQNEADDYYEKENWEDRAKYAETELESALTIISRWRSEASAALARVAELEAQLAAQEWRNFTEHPPIGEPIQITTVIDAVREEPDGLYRIGHTDEWQAWRPAPQEPPQ